MTDSVREALKATARAIAIILVVPAVCSFHLRSALIGPNRALLGSTQALAPIPGLTGQYLRRAFLWWTLAHCAPSAAIEYGTLFSSPDARIDDHVYIGPNCHIGHAHLEHDVLLAPCVHVPSGGRTHGTDDPSQPIRNQPGDHQLVRIEAGAWIGSASVVMANVGAGTVVGAGSVVTKPLPPGVVAAGVPARPIRSRVAPADAERPS